MENNNIDLKKYIEEHDTYQSSEMEAIITLIIGLTETQEKIERTNEFLEKFENYIINNYEVLIEKEIEEKIQFIVNRFNEYEFGRKILSERNFNIENILNKIKNPQEDIEENKDVEKEEEKEIDKIEYNIQQLTNKQLNLITDEKYLNSSIEDINEEINKLTTSRNNNWNYSYNNSLNLSNLKIDENNKLIDDVTNINSKIKELENIKRAKNNKYYGITNEELNNKAYELTNELNNIEYYSLKNELKKLNDEVRENGYLLPNLNKEEKEAYEFLKYKINNIKSKLDEKEEIYKIPLEELKKELKEIDKVTNVLDSLSFGDNNKKEDYKKQQERIKYLKEIINEREKIESIKLELNNINNELKDRENNLSLDERNKLNNLKNIKAAYDNIVNEAIEKFNNNEIDNIEEFVNNHKDIDVINNYENSEKLKKELIKEIKNKLNLNKEKDNKINKIDNNKKLWMKSLACAAGGFAVGLAASTITPHLGVIIFGAKAISKVVQYATKEIYKEINIQAKNNPAGKCTDIVNFVQKQKEKHSNIINKVNIMREKLKEKPLKYLINGFYAGVVVGNIVEATTGKDIGEHISEAFKNNSNGIAQVTPGNVTPGNVTPGNVTPEIMSNSSMDFSSLTGQSYDLSSVPEGFVSSYSNEPVSLLTESAKNLSLDKANIVNGEEWWHFLKPDGEGYAWFKADDVRHLVEGTLKSGRSI